MSQVDKIYGIHAVESVLTRKPENVIQLFLLKNRKDKALSTIEALAKKAGIKCQSIDRKKMDERAHGNHQGVIAEVKVSDANMSEGDLLQLAADKETLLLLILDGVTDPHNLGACIRTADAAGVDAIVLPKDRSAQLNATVRKVACGAAENVPLVKVTNLARFLKQLKEEFVWIVGTAGEAEGDLYSESFSAKTAIVMGAEGAGMRRLTREHCDQLIKIPMAGSVSSLNVSVATGVCLFEYVRQQATKNNK
ncbi:MAG: 23S rRNA (guanosine(2251)-2'-O)-methyltransferase RlmB [Kangiellaceae bacterium]|nr:23S rRNA (guanosine(2251)-2'-O)-methyltransferase RlmB [Kangiellaceae bacterium]